jgi:hypothetical protein
MQRWKGGMAVQHPRVDDVRQRLGVNAHAHTKVHGLGHGCHGDAQDKVVANLRHLA